MTVHQPRSYVRYTVKLLILTCELVFFLSALTIQSVSAIEPSWTCVGPYGGAITTLAHSEDKPALLCAGTTGSGLFRSSDYGHSWMPLAFSGRGISACIFFPTQPATLIAGVKQENELHVSRDWGMTWHRISQTFDGEIVALVPLVAEKIVIIADAGGNLFALSLRTGEIEHRSHCMSGLRTVIVGNTTKVLIGGGEEGVAISHDQGHTWITIWRANFPVIDVFQPDAAGGDILTGTMSGATWLHAENTIWRSRPIALPRIPIRSFVTLGENGNDSRIISATAGRGLFESSDQGRTWKTRNSGLESLDVTALISINGRMLVAGTLGWGIFRSENAGETWEESQYGFSASFVSSLQSSEFEQSPQHSPVLTITTLTGSWESPLPFDEWKPRNLVDVFASNRSICYPEGGRVLYRTSKIHAVERSIDGGQSWQSFGNGIQATTAISLLIEFTEQGGSLIAGTWGSGVCFRSLRSVPSCSFGGTLRTIPTIYNPAQGSFLVQDQASAATPISALQGDIPVPADYNGDGITEFALYRPSVGLWLISGEDDVLLGGDPSDIPVPGDYNGDGLVECAVFRAKTGFWIIESMAPIGWGSGGNLLPVPADYDGDGRTDCAFYTLSGNMIGHWWIRNREKPTGWGGDPSDIPIPADYNGDGKAELAVYRSSTGEWLIENWSPRLYGGDPSDIPVPGDYDGDGSDDIAVYRSREALWAVQRNSVIYCDASASDVPLVLPWHLFKHWRTATQ